MSDLRDTLLRAHQDWNHGVGETRWTSPGHHRRRDRCTRCVEEIDANLLPIVEAAIGRARQEGREDAGRALRTIAGWHSDERCGECHLATCPNATCWECGEDRPCPTMRVIGPVSDV